MTYFECPNHALNDDAREKSDNPDEIAEVKSTRKPAHPKTKAQSAAKQKIADPKPGNMIVRIQDGPQSVYVTVGTFVPRGLKPTGQEIALLLSGSCDSENMRSSNLLMQIFHVVISWPCFFRCSCYDTNAECNHPKKR